MSLRKRSIVVQRNHAGYSLGVCLLLILGTSLASGQAPVGKNDRRQRADRPTIRLAEAKNGRKSSTTGETSAEDGESQVYLREGDRINNVVGTFTVKGDDVTFKSDDGRLVLGTLPNLNLERARADSGVNNTDNTVKWTISGMITEYNKTNFVLISRVIKKSASSLQKEKSE